MTTNPYDEVPYASHPYAQTHPARLATIATLLSAPSPPIATARILEIGCAAGGNIIPIACDYPDARIIGVDYSQVQIDEGRRTVDALGLRNIELRAADLASVDATWGEFDYIICHGVYSWVAPPLQEKILAIAGRQLSPTGVAYVSYNALPGWHMRGVIRELMRYHALRFDGPQRRVAEARRILDIVHKHAASSTGGAYNQLLQFEADVLSRSDDHYIYHEHLEEHCEPLYFHQFIDRAREHGLDYLGEPQLGAMAPLNYGPEAQQQLRQLARDPIELEQFMDFLSNRSFRQTLLRRAGAKLNLALEPRLIESLHISGRGDLQNGDPNAAVTADDPPATFRSNSGATVTTPRPLVKAAILELSARWPASLPFEGLFPAACRRLDVEPADELRQRLARALLLAMTTSDLLEASVEPTLIAVDPGDYPLAKPYTRYQAEHSPLVTNGRHELAKLTPAEQSFLQHLDGQHNRDQLARLARVPIQRINEQIERFARLGLLIPTPN